MRSDEVGASLACLRQSELAGAVEAELRSDGAEGFYAESDVVVEGDAEFFCAFVDIVAIYAAGEGLVFEFFFHRGGFDFVDAFRGFDQGAGGQKARELIAGEEGVVERRNARGAGIVCVTENGVNDLLGVAALAENLRAFVGMLLRRVVIGVRPALVIKIVEQGGEAPGIFVAAEFSRVGADAGFDCEGVFAQAFSLRVFAEKMSMHRLGSAFVS